MKKSFIIDGNGVFFRYLFALPEMENSNGIKTHGVLGFCNCIMNLIKKNPDAHFFVALDKCSENFRKDILPSYKQNRKKVSMNVFEQIEMITEFCNLSGIPVEFHKNFEADDIIASFVSKNTDEDITIISVDKDLYQLVNKKVKIFNPFKRIFIDEKKVSEILGVTPNKVHLFLALVGDASDNIPGIEGIGPKTAAKILQNFTEIEDIKKNFIKFNFTNLEQMISLTKLRKDVDLANSEIYSINPNIKAIRNFFQEMNFNSLMHYLI